MTTSTDKGGKTAEKSTPSEAPVTAGLWTVGLDPRSQVLLAGLLADDPTLRTAELPATEWRKRLSRYENTERV